MAEVITISSNRKTIQRHRAMLENLTDVLNQEIGGKGKVRLSKETREYGWGYLIDQKLGWIRSRDLAVFEHVGDTTFGYKEDSPVIVQVRVYNPEVLETVKRIVSEYANKPESNVSKVEISPQF